MPTGRVPALSVVVPVYNSAATLPELVSRLEAVLAASADEFEAVFVNDGSRDTSWRALVELARRHPWIRAFDLVQNVGQHNALLCGIRAARHALIVTLDDDLQNPPEELPKLLGALADEVDLVYGAPLREVHGRWRDLASRGIKFGLRAAFGAEMARVVGPFRVFRTDLRRSFETFQGSFVNIDVLLAWATRRVAAVRVRHDPRRVGESNYSVWTLAAHSFNMLIGFSIGRFLARIRVKPREQPRYAVRSAAAGAARVETSGTHA